MTTKNTLTLLLLGFLISSNAACQWSKKQDLNKRYGEPKVIHRVSVNSDATLYNEARETLDKRCVVCHACYDAPCQLKLSSFDGIDRGASKKLVYGSRVIAADPTRLFEDGSSTEQWRQKAFYPVLNERQQSPEANLELSLIHQLLVQKKEHPLPENQALPEQIDVSLYRKQSCPKIEEYDKYKKDRPYQGMPFGMPHVSDQEFSTLEKWLAAGAFAPPENKLSEQELSTLNKWETFFNKTDLQSRLVNRYLFEHLYLANLYFEDKGINTKFFKLVRSYSPPGSPIRVISSRMPFDDPYTKEFYYRLRPVEQTIVNKTHMPYALGQKRYDFWQDIFFSQDFNIEELPSYDAKVAANPFIAFADIPVYARYRFLLSEAQFTIMNFIKGPVCRGQVALDVINDDFWVVFGTPEVHKNGEHDAFFRDNAELFRFPAYWGSQGSLFSWIDLSNRSKEYMEARAKYFQKISKTLPPQTESFIWDGDNNTNDNAALTVFRHFDSATVLKGFAGTQPKTAWLIGYGLLERIHYLLVAGFDVNGTIQHQLVTRLYMEFLRMEGEAAFISLLPKDEQAAKVLEWNQEPGNKLEEHYKILLDNGEGIPLQIDYKTDNHQVELLDLLSKHTNANRYKISPKGLNKNTFEQIAQMNQIQGLSASYFPEAVFMRLRTKTGNRWFTILRHSQHKNLNHLLSEDKTRLPELDKINILPGLLIAYPNRFLDIDESQFSEVIKVIETSKSKTEMAIALSPYALSRMHPSFWSFSDELHQAFAKQAGIEYGLFDYNRLQRF